MLLPNFLYATALLAIGIGALMTGQSLEEAPMGYTGIFFGGSALICALFAIKNRRHGLMAAGFLSFLAVLTGAKEFFTLLNSHQLMFNNPQVIFLCAFLAISAAYLTATIFRWRTQPFSDPAAESQ